MSQGSAANAEESAAASEELSAQAGQLDAMVGELQKIIGGRTVTIKEHKDDESAIMDQIHENVKARMQNRPPVIVHAKRSGMNYAVDPMVNSKREMPGKSANAPMNTKDVEEMIPMDDFELSKF